MRRKLLATLDLADLSLAGSIEANGDDLTYELTVSNGGPDPAESVGLALTLPDGTSFTGVTTSTGSCEESDPGVVTCALGDAATGEVGHITVTATVAGPGPTPGAVATVASATYEADADDNRLTLSH